MIRFGVRRVTSARSFGFLTAAGLDVAGNVHSLGFGLRKTAS